MSTFKAMWAELSGKGKSVVAVVIILAIAGLLAMAMWLGYNLDWLPNIIADAV
jgi:hypothetical protein